MRTAKLLRAAAKNEKEAFWKFLETTKARAAKLADDSQVAAAETEWRRLLAIVDELRRQALCEDEELCQY